jgi:hypothetical protein
MPTREVGEVRWCEPAEAATLLSYDPAIVTSWPACPTRGPRPRRSRPGSNTRRRRRPGRASAASSTNDSAGSPQDGGSRLRPDPAVCPPVNADGDARAEECERLARRRRGPGARRAASGPSLRRAGSRRRGRRERRSSRRTGPCRRRSTRARPGDEVPDGGSLAPTSPRLPSCSACVASIVTPSTSTVSPRSISTTRRKPRLVRSRRRPARNDDEAPSGRAVGATGGRGGRSGGARSTRRPTFEAGPRSTSTTRGGGATRFLQQRIGEQPDAVELDQHGAVADPRDPDHGEESGSLDPATRPSADHGCVQFLQTRAWST